MRHVVVHLTSAFLLALLAGCCTNQGATRPLTDRDTITVGSGGGITGAYSGYRLDGDGAVYAWTRMPGGADSTRFLFTLSPDTTRMVFRRLDTMEFDTIEFSHPGNITYYVERRVDSTSHTVRWSRGDDRVPEPVRTFYNETVRMIIDRAGDR